jgi:hypothetical protein
MGFLGRLLGRADRTEEADGEQGARASRTDLAEEPITASAPEPDGPCVVAYLKLADPEFANEREQMRLFALEDRLMAAVDASGAGTYEGNYVERGFFRLYAAGPDAERLADVVRPLLAEAPRGSILVKRNGPPGTEEERIPL